MTSAGGRPAAAASATRWMRRISELAEPSRCRAERPWAAIVPTSAAAMSSRIVVSTSSRESMANDR